MTFIYQNKVFSLSEFYLLKQSISLDDLSHKKKYLKLLLKTIIFFLSDLSS